MNNQKTAVIYARVSTVRQADEELPIAGQIERCHARAAELGLLVNRVFKDEGISGGDETRPGFNDAITYCEVFEINCFITWSTSRFARNKITASVYKRRLDRCNTEIIFITTPMDRNTTGGWLLEGVLELFDELYSRQISADTMRSMVKNANAGNFNGGSPPFGFSVVADPDAPRRKKLAVCELESGIVAEIFTMRVRGLGGKSIAVLLNERGLSNRGRAWSKSTVLALLRNEAMIGKTVFGRKDRNTGRRRARAECIAVASHPAIVSADVWESVQLMMDQANNSDAGGSPRSQFVFTGLLRCGQCKSRLQIESGSGRSKKYQYYNCRMAQQNGSCTNRRLPAHELDALLIESISTSVFTRENLVGVVEELERECGAWAHDRRRRRQATAGQLSSYQNKSGKIYELFELYGKETPNLADLTGRLRENNAHVRSLELELAGIDAESVPELDVSVAQVDELAEALAGLVKSSTDAKKLRGFFAGFILAIRIDGNQARIEYDPCKLVKTPVTAVHNTAVWLPGRSLLGTRTLALLLPERFRPMAA